MRLSNSPYEVQYTLAFFAGSGFSTILPYSIMTNPSFTLSDPFTTTLLVMHMAMFIACVAAAILRLTPSVASNRVTLAVSSYLLLVPPFGTIVGIYYFYSIRKIEIAAWQKLDEDLSLRLEEARVSKELQD